MIQSDTGTPSTPLWSIDRKMNHQAMASDKTSFNTSSSLSLPSTLWDSTPFGKSLNLRLCQREQLSPQLILEDKVFRSAIRCQHGSTYRTQIQFVGTLIIDDETQRLTYVIDRLQLSDSPANESNNLYPLSSSKQLNSEFLIPIRFDLKNGSTSTMNNSSIQDAIKLIETYCRSSSPIELHQFSALNGQMSSRLTPSINADLSFDLLTVKNSFKLTPINPESVQMLPTALLKNLSATSGNGIYINQPHFGYCGVDRMSKNKILLILENDPQACALPLVGIWVSGIVEVQCAYVWAACLRYCMNSSLKQRLKSGVHTDDTSQQSFLLACYLSTSRGQCDFYEVRATVPVSSTSFVLDYDLWTCSKKIIMPNPSSSLQHESNATAQLPYDFEFKHVYDGPKMYALLGAHGHNSSIPMTNPSSRLSKDTKISCDISFLSAEIPSDDDDDDEHENVFEPSQNRPQSLEQTTMNSPDTNGSLFGVPRLPPKQANHQSPSWDSVSTTTLATPRWIAPVPAMTKPAAIPAPAPPPPIRFSSPAPSTIAPSTIVSDVQWKEEMLEKMQEYNAQIQSLNALVSQLIAAQQLQQQQNLLQQQQLQQQQQQILSGSIRESTKCDVAVQSEPPSPCMSDDVGESASMVKSNRTSPPSPKIDPFQQYQHQTPIIMTATRSSTASAQFQSSVPMANRLAPLNYQPEPIIDYISLRKSFDSERIVSENTPVGYQHRTPVRSISPPPPLSIQQTLPKAPVSASADVNPVDILKPFFQYMASQQQKQKQQQQQQQETQRSRSPIGDTSHPFEMAVTENATNETDQQLEKIPPSSNAVHQHQQIQPITQAQPVSLPMPTQQQHVTSTTTTGISFISNGLQMQFFNQQSSITTVYPPASIPTAPTLSSSVQTTSSNQPSENDLSIEVRSLAMKYLEDDQLAVAIEYDRQSPTPPSTVRQSPQVFDKSMSFATQKYFEKYGILSGSSRQQQYYAPSDDQDLVIDSPTSTGTPARMLMPLPPTSTAPLFTQPSGPNAPQAKILDLSQIRKLPKLL